jgi:hypothetical protein
MKNLKDQLDEMYSKIYSVCDDEGSDDVLDLLNDVCEQGGVEEISERYFDDAQLTDEEATRLLEVFEIVLDEIS